MRLTSRCASIRRSSVRPRGEARHGPAPIGRTQRAGRRSSCGRRYCGFGLWRVRCWARVVDCAPRAMSEAHRSWRRRGRTPCASALRSIFPQVDSRGEDRSSRHAGHTWHTRTPGLTASGPGHALEVRERFVRVRGAAPQLERQALTGPARAAVLASGAGAASRLRASRDRSTRSAPRMRAPWSWRRCPSRAPASSASRARGASLPVTAARRCATSAPAASGGRAVPTPAKSPLQLPERPGGRGDLVLAVRASASAGDTRLSVASDARGLHLAGAGGARFFYGTAPGSTPTVGERRCRRAGPARASSCASPRTSSTPAASPRCCIRSSAPISGRTGPCSRPLRAAPIGRGHRRQQPSGRLLGLPAHPRGARRRGRQPPHRRLDRPRRGRQAAVRPQRRLRRRSLPGHVLGGRRRAPHDQRPCARRRRDAAGHRQLRHLGGGCHRRRGGLERRAFPGQLDGLRRPDGHPRGGRRRRRQRDRGVAADRVARRVGAPAHRRRRGRLGRGLGGLRRHARLHASRPRRPRRARRNGAGPGRHPPLDQRDRRVADQARLQWQRLPAGLAARGRSQHDPGRRAERRGRHHDAGLHDPALDRLHFGAGRGVRRHEVPGRLGGRARRAGRLRGPHLRRRRGAVDRGRAALDRSGQRVLLQSDGPGLERVALPRGVPGRPRAGGLHAHRRRRGQPGDARAHHRAIGPVVHAARHQPVLQPGGVERPGLRRHLERPA